MGIRRDLESMVLGKQSEVFIAFGITQSRESFFVVDITKTFVEKQREDELLVVPCINRPPQEHGGTPEVGFELLLGDAGHG
jgi:hypothetical protein